MFTLVQTLIGMGVLMAGMGIGISILGIMLEIMISTWLESEKRNFRTVMTVIGLLVAGIVILLGCWYGLRVVYSELW